ncbi:mucin-5AC-like [Cucurbita maxima]|uniref:Mucin-5AC-like n=1 Tax=Cucurbita maxima TaxID=3661 RepID=A0A6J1IVA8_CUCMA|nr:mucin-5AC-like [Cucurbita maxima]
MDSGSGSLQSSSGGDDDYDSHRRRHHHYHHQEQQQQPHLFPPPPPPLFFNATMPPHQPLPFHLSHHNFQNLYDFPSNFNLQPTNFNPDSSNSFLNLDDDRPNPTSLRSEPTTTTTFKTPISAEGSTHHTQIPNRSTNPSPTGLHPKPTTKKRTRASRRAPTTVLTTDTTNFRAMVQEFTGIPSPPFTAPGSSSSSSSSFSRRFDLFASVRANTTTTTNLEPSGSGFHPSRSKVQLFSSLNNTNNNNVTIDDQNTSRVQPAGIFSFQSVSEGTHLEPPQIHGSSTSQELLSALQNDEAWRSNSTAATTTAAATTATTTNCKLKFTGSSSSSNNLQQTLLGNIVATTTTSRGERTVESWICPSD